MESCNVDSVPSQIIEIHPNRSAFNLDLGAVWRHRGLLYFLIWRDFKVRYKQAVMGIAWAIVQPVFMVIIFTVVFGKFAKIPSDGIPYPLFAFTALLPWTYFSEAVRRGSMGLVDDSELIRKIYFPRLIIPLAKVVAPMVDFLISFAVLAALLLWYGIMPTWGVVFLPVFVFIALILALAVALWLGPINVRFRDVQHTLPFLLQVWMYASPIVYPLSIVPEQWKLLYSLNPMVGVIEGFRWALLGTSNPDFVAMSLSAVFVLLVLLAGIVYFKKMERVFADVI